MIWRESPNFGARIGTPPIVDMMVFHYTDMACAEAAMDRLCDPAMQVSAHYLIDEDGTLYQLVSEEHRAWHAGHSFWRGDRDINSRSIGIELQNPGHEPELRPFPDRQIDALIDLCRQTLARHPIPPGGIVAHSDIAPDRKRDPGELFPWARLAAAGIGVFPSDGIPTDLTLPALLDRIGYDPDSRDRVRAFQRRFLPDQITGTADRMCCERAAAYLDLCPSR